MDEGPSDAGLPERLPELVEASEEREARTMSGQGNPVVDAVRRALGRSPGDPVAPRPGVLPPRPAGSADAEVAAFLREVAALSGVALCVRPEDINRQLESLVREHEVRRACLWATPLLARTEVAERLGRLGVGIVPHDAGDEALAECDLGVTEADFALPETGTIGLLSSAERPRVVSLLPRIHLALVDPAVVRADLHDVFAEARQAPYLVFVTGPSRTADIELKVTLGVHGPQQLHVWVV
jgi:L-lactate dehydrogenase complex protein LldG